MKKLPKKAIIEEVEQIISTGKTVELKVEGNSMRPYLRGGKDVIVVSPFQAEDLKPGTIVLFRYRNDYIFHRIIKIKNDVLIIQGDGTYKQYEEAQKSDVIGIVSRIIRPSGKQVSTNTYLSGFYWRCWRFLRPVRRYLLGGMKLLFRR